MILKACNRRANLTERTLACEKIVGRFVLREGEIRDAEIDDGFEAIVDFGGGDDRSAGLFDHRFRALERLAGISHVVTQEDAACGHDLLVERSQLERATGVD